MIAPPSQRGGALRSAAKRVVELAGVWSGAARALRAASRSRALVLAYHNILPEGDRGGGGRDHSLHLAQRSFARQLDGLLGTHDVVPLDALLGTPERRSTRPRVAITFDDAYRGAVALGVEELARRDLPATIFVAPALLGGRTLWWDALLGGGDAAAEELRTQALEALRGEDAAIRAWASGAGMVEAQVPKHAATATEEELRAALHAHPGLTLGSHSWSHPNLARLPADELHEELERPLAWLRERFDRVIPWLAYPYGLSSPEAERAAAEVGYRAAVRVSGGWLPTTKLNPFALPRFNVPAGLSPEGFLLRTAGLLRS